MGLAGSRHIARVIVDPVDHDVVYVAALGSLWGAGKERGVFKTTDGGLTWTNVLFVNEDTGATELVMDPANNKVLYAATYQRRRATWGFNGGGPGSAIHKSSDAGRTWTKLTDGIPSGPLGRIGLDVYRANPNILYARIEHEKESGVYRSDNAGQSWRKMSSVNPRPMYFSQIRIDPTNDLRVYVLGVQLHISDDGGKTFIENGAMHSDHHAMWINPANPNHIIDGNDGGVGLSYDKGATWEAITNMDLGQFYHVTYDMQTPYHVCGGLQDNYTWCGPSAVRSRSGIGNDDWRQIQGGDGFEAQMDPRDGRTVYAESQDGNIVRVDRLTGERKSIRPVAARGEPPLRWNWNTPIVLSAHNPDTIYVARQQGVQVRRPRPELDRHQPGPDAEHRPRNPQPDGRHRQGVHARQARRRAVLRQSRAARGVAAAGRRALRRRRRWQRLHDQGRRQELDEHHEQVPRLAEGRVRLTAGGLGTRRRHGLRHVRQPPQRRLRHVRLRERRWR